MSWRRAIIDQWAEKLRFTVRAALFVNAILISLTSIYLVAKALWFLVGFLNRTVFAHPW